MNDIFRSAALKLTLWYLLIIMGLSFLFSGSLYRISSEELARNTSRQISYFNDELAPGDFNAYRQLRQKQYNESLDNLRGSLVLFNLLVLVGGGLVSYVLARRTLRPIEESLNAQKRFTGDASHELRTPLTAMQTEIEVALRNPKLTRNESIELLKSNLEEVNKLKDLSEGLLSLAGNNEKNLDKDRLQVPEILAQAVDRNLKNAEAKNIKLTSKAASLNVHGDRASLVQLVSILLDNAIKYTPRGGQVEVTAERRDKHVQLRVKDNGQGITAEDLPRIFDRFYRADSSRSKEAAEGYGLGLAIAKKIADLHGAYIEVKSAPKKGSTFTVHMPS